MKTTKTVSLLVSLLIATAVLASEALAQRHFERHQPRMLGIERLADELELTEGQIAKFKEQRFATEKSSIEMHSKIQIAKLELHELMQDEKPNENIIKNKVKEIGRLRTELELTRVEGRLSIRRVLTSEQLKKLKTIKKRPMRKHQRRGGSFPNRGQFRHFQDDFEFGEFDLQQDSPHNE